MKLGSLTLLFLAQVVVISTLAQSVPRQHANYPAGMRSSDSLRAMQTPLLEISPSLLRRSLPPAVNNAANEYWPRIYDQFNYYSCQQYAGVVYTFGYEMSRIKNRPGWYWENSYPSHYTWNFMNLGEQYTGVNFLQSFEVIRQQGHMNMPDFGGDTAGGVLGWASGYDRYFHAMHNRISRVSAIVMNEPGGVAALRNYLFDHLDGSSTGGIACFTTDSWSLILLAQLPPGTPEEGKHIVLTWKDNPVHGLAIVGYNDSIRYDLNADGQFTNHLDINSDGKVDERDWEIGGFLMANSYGEWWADAGFCYVLYSAMAKDYEKGGVWNNRVYVVEPDTAYRPSLTVKARVSHNHRNKLRMLAGIATDTLAALPQKTISFPIFNFQGGTHAITGYDTCAGENSLEFGLDVTPLLNEMGSKSSTRLFFGIEEQDPEHLGTGQIHESGFFSYVEGTRYFAANTAAVDIGNNRITWCSAVVNLPKPEGVRITSESLPPLQLSYTATLEATGGKGPYHWNLLSEPVCQSFGSPMPAVTGTPLVMTSNGRPYAAVKLPFTFPYFGRSADTIFVNSYGFIAFDEQVLPPPYITDEVLFLSMISAISPAFCQTYRYLPSRNDGVFVQADSSRVTIRWQASVEGHYNVSSENFALRLYPDGTFEIIFGSLDGPELLPAIYSGFSAGDGLNHSLERQLNPAGLAGSAKRYIPSPLPAGTTLSQTGLLEVKGFDPSTITNLRVQVTDGLGLTDQATLQLSPDLQVETETTVQGGGPFRFGSTAQLDLKIRNGGLNPLPSLKLVLSTSDTNLQITDTLVNITGLLPGDSLHLEHCFAFSLTEPVKDGTPLLLTLCATSDTIVRKLQIRIGASASCIEVVSPVVDDGDNHLLEPGEVADLVVNLRNIGSLPQDDVSLRLESLDSLVTIVGEESRYVGRCEPLSEHPSIYRLARDRSAGYGFESSLKLTVRSGNTVLRELLFVLPSGPGELALVNLTNETGSFDALMTCFDTLSLNPDTLFDLAFDFQKYTSIFLILGHSTNGSHALTLDESGRLAKYLNEGGSLYMEGYYTWHYTDNNILHPLFKYTSSSSSRYNFKTLYGAEGTFAEGQVYSYPNEMDFALFNFLPVNPAFTLFHNGDTMPHPLEIGFAGPNYRTVGSMIAFGTREGTPAQRTALVEGYLDHFGVNRTGLHPFFHADQREPLAGTKVQFTDDSFDGVTGWQWEFPGGNPSVSTLQNPLVIYSDAGTFDVHLTINNGQSTRSLTRRNYITVKPVSSVGEHPMQHILRLYPNPAGSTVNILLPPCCRDNPQVFISDITGRGVLAARPAAGIDDGSFTLQIDALPRGLYLLTVVTAGTTLSAKLVVQ